MSACVLRIYAGIDKIEKIQKIDIYPAVLQNRG
jgi:hypothetical protein